MGKPQCFAGPTGQCAVTCGNATSCGTGYCCDAGTCTYAGAGRLNTCP
jgi:hypothetical protein